MKTPQEWVEFYEHGDWNGNLNEFIALVQKDARATTSASKPEPLSAEDLSAVKDFHEAVKRDVIAKLEKKEKRRLYGTPATPEGGWLIEHHSSEVSSPAYWCGKDDWTKDHLLKAVRFSRREDAESASEFLVFIEDETYKHRVSYHEWG